MIIEAYGMTDVGKKRKENEDAYLIDRELGLYVVCDGLGGHAAGRAAADLAIAAIRASVQRATRKYTGLRSGNASHSDLFTVASIAVDDACAEVYRKAISDTRYNGMGCTVTLLLVSGSRAAIAHVGDSAIYLCRDEETEQLNMSHTFAGDMIRGGALTPDAAKTSRFSHVLSRAVGTHETVISDKLILDLLPGDTFLLCTDGITRHIEGDAEFTSFLSEDHIRHIPAQLVGLANARGGNDNSTAVVVRAVQPAEGGSASGRGTDVRAEVRCIRAGKVFQDITLANALRISAFSKARTCKQGEVLVNKGETISSVFLVMSGALSLGSDGTEVRTLVPSEAAGLETLFGFSDARYEIRAREESIVLDLNSEELMDLARRRPWFGMDILTRAGAEICR